MLTSVARRRTFLSLALATALSIGVSGCGGPSPEVDPSGPTTIRMALQQENFATMPLFLSQDLGFMADEGLTIETTVGQGTSTMTAGLLGGSFDMQIGGAELLVARQQGAPLVAVAGLNNAPVWSVITRSGLTGLPDLRGRTIATSGPDSVSTVVLIAALRTVGLEPQDYSMITAGGTAERFAAVQNGLADATLVAAPQEFQAETSGLQNLGPLSETFPEFASGFVATTREFSTERAAVLDRFARAWSRTFAWMHDRANGDELVRRVAGWLDTPEPVIRQAYDYYWQTDERASAMFAAGGRISETALGSAAQTFVASGSLPASATDLTGFVVPDFLDHAAGAR